MVDSKPASHHSIKEQQSSAQKATSNHVELKEQNDPSGEALEPDGPGTLKNEEPSPSGGAAKVEDEVTPAPASGSKPSAAGSTENTGGNAEPPVSSDEPNTAEQTTDGGDTVAEPAAQPESPVAPDVLSEPQEPPSEPQHGPSEPDDGREGPKTDADGAVADPAAGAKTGEEAAVEGEDAPSTEGTMEATETVLDEETEFYAGEMTESGEYEGEETTIDDTIASTLGEAEDVLSELQPKSSILAPIPEPDFSDLENKEKLFPRPAISNPKVCYELSCKQLGVVPISQYLRSLDTYAEDLRFQSYGLARLDMLSLCHSLAYNTTATSLNLSNNRLEQDILPNIEAMMNDNSFIGTINLSRNNLTGPSLRSLQTLFSNNFTLTSLDLSHCQMLDSDAPALAAVIEVSLNLRVLNLSYNEFSDCGKIFGKVMAADEGLEILDFGWNLFWSKSAKDLLLGLRSNTRLRRLDLSRNSLGPDTVKAVRAVLNKNATLVELDISHNRLNDACMRTIALGLAKNSTLEKCWVGHNPVTPVGALALGRSLSKMSVNYVDLSNIDVSADFMKFKSALDPETITVVHGTVHQNMVLIEPPKKKGARAPPKPTKKKK